MLALSAPVIEKEEEKYYDCLVGGDSCVGKFLSVRNVRTCPKCIRTDGYSNMGRMIDL